MSESRQTDFQALSTEIAQIYKTHYGRGPTKITAAYMGDAVVCLLEDVNLPAQTALLNRGKTDLAQAIHAELQLGMADAMSETVQRITGRTVRTYVPGFNATGNATTDVFFLEPVAAA
ncbi:unannotated protein [freshwater metagenome]|uniref:Unannotated protein n=1 Tax=freshwater metagenome TaxID=449393 RepID=A0A6J7FIU4_9ZZZZ|nr:DUF2294 family protein [Actinomycetota bacterium]